MIRYCHENGINQIIVNKRYAVFSTSHLLTFKFINSKTCPQDHQVIPWRPTKDVTENDEYPARQSCIVKRISNLKFVLGHTTALYDLNKLSFQCLD